MSKKAPETITKTPAEVRLVNFDFAEDLDGSAALASAVFTITPSGPGVQNYGVSGNLAQARITAGTAGLYTLAAKVTDDGSPSQTYEGVGVLVIEALG
jgi:hypothetical protein